MPRKKTDPVPQAPEAPTVMARVMNGKGIPEPVPVADLVVFPHVYRSPVELESSRGWLFAVKNGKTVPFMPSVFKVPNGMYSVLGWVSK